MRKGTAAFENAAAIAGDYLKAENGLLIDSDNRPITPEMVKARLSDGQYETFYNVLGHERLKAFEKECWREGATWLDREVGSFCIKVRTGIEVRCGRSRDLIRVETIEYPED